MAFIKIDDGLPEHRKIVAACDRTELAGWLFVSGLTYCNRNRTDGFIPAAIAPKLIIARRPKPAVEALVAEGLWRRVEGGYHVHDYLEHQSSAEEINATSVKRAQAGSKGAAKRWQSANGADGKPNGEDIAEVRSKKEESLTAPPQRPPEGASGNDFDTWLTDHEQVTGMRPPKQGTKARRNISASFADRLNEGYSLDELKLATLGAFTDPNRRENGWYDPESVLRPGKVYNLVEKGRRAATLGGATLTAADRGVTDMLDWAAEWRKGGEAA